jgi:ketosteroid isomerase-like protein
MPNSDVIRSAFEAYLAQDRDAAEKLYAEDFTFTSPQDDHIDRAAFFERCFPTADRVTSQEILQLVDAGDGGFVMYEYVLKTGDRHRNTEYLTVRDGQIVTAEVFFGGKY